MKRNKNNDLLIYSNKQNKNNLLFYSDLNELNFDLNARENADWLQ